MKGFIERHSNSFVTAIFSLCITAIAVLSSIFCFFNGHKDIPLGFALGGVIIAGLYFLSALAEKHDDKKQSATFSLIMISVRMMVLAATMIIVALMYYRWNLPIFNIFTFVASYTAAIICNVIVHLLSKK